MGWCANRLTASDARCFFKVLCLELSAQATELIECGLNSTHAVERASSVLVLSVEALLNVAWVSTSALGIKML